MAMRSIFRVKAAMAYLMLRLRRGHPHQEARKKARCYYQLECLRQNNGFSFVIRKPALETS